MPASPVTKSIGTLSAWHPFRRAFSLIEMMVAMSLLSVLVVMLTGLFNQVNKAWITGEGGTERRRGARAVTDFLAEELRGAQIPIGGGGTVAQGNLHFIVNPPDLPADYRHADAIFWQAPIATESSFGDIAAVGYFVKWGTTAQGQRPMLCRFFVNPSKGSGTQLARNPDFLVYDNNPDAWLKNSLIESVVQPDTQAEGYKGLFAENILGLWIECLDRNGKKIAASGAAKFDSRKGYLADISSEGVTWQEKRYLPISIRVSLAQIDSHYAHRLANPSAQSAVKSLSKSSNSADEFLASLQSEAASSDAVSSLLPGVRIYSTEVQLRNAL